MLLVLVLFNLLPKSKEFVALLVLLLVVVAAETLRAVLLVISLAPKFT